ncbi:MAG: hypothetical protein ACI36Y_04040 [Coriobacteriales bacterium]
MEHESSSKVVRGLSIATIVLSILGIVFVLGLGACSATFTTAVEKELVDPVADQPFDIEGYMGEISDAMEEITGTSLTDFSLLVVNNDISAVHELGQVIQGGDAAQIEKMPKSMAKKSGADIDAHQLALSFVGLGVEDMREFGIALQQVTEEDYLDLIVVLSDANGLYAHAGDPVGNYTVGEVGDTVSKLIIALIWFFVIVDVLGCAVTLVASVLSLRNASNPDKLTGAFVWSIIGAVIALLGCRLITMALLIINCVYIHKVRSFRQAPAAPGDCIPPAAPYAEAPQPAPAGDNAAPVPPQE